MPIRVTCDSCGKHYQVPDSAAGRKGRCKNCGNVIVVPAVPPVAAPDVTVIVADAPPAPAAPPRTTPPPPIPEKPVTVIESPPIMPAQPRRHQPSPIDVEPPPQAVVGPSDAPVVHASAAVSGLASPEDAAPAPSSENAPLAEPPPQAARMAPPVSPAQPPARPRTMLPLIAAAVFLLVIGGLAFAYAVVKGWVFGSSRTSIVKVESRPSPAGGGNTPRPPDTKPRKPAINVADLPVWQPDPAVLDKLGEEVVLPPFAFRPPSRLQPNGKFWEGPATPAVRRNGGTISPHTPNIVVDVGLARNDGYMTQEAYLEAHRSAVVGRVGDLVLIRNSSIDSDLFTRPRYCEQYRCYSGDKLIQFTITSWDDPASETDRDLAASVLTLRKGPLIATSPVRP